MNKYIKHVCAFTAAFLLNLPIARGVTGLKVSLLVRDEVATQDDSEPVVLSGENSLEEHLKSLKILSEADYDSLTEYVADPVDQEKCMDWDSDEDISPKGDLEVEDDRDKVVDESMYFLIESTTTYTPGWCENVINYSRNQYSGRYSKHYVIEDDVSPTKLAKDAKLIQEAMKGDKSFTTIFCVALRDKHGHIKKFACCNSELMPPDCRKQAEDLGYAVIKAEQSHAEGQFLHKRARINPGLYTHIVAMGCSKLHCPECDFVLKLVLGSNYKAISAAIGAVTEDIT